MYKTNDVLTMKKSHPCGGKMWTVVGAGADIRLKCLTCGKIVILTRDELKKRAREISSPAEEADVERSAELLTDDLMKKGKGNGEKA